MLNVITCLNNKTVSFQETGNGPQTLLMIHGSNQSKATFAQQFASPLLQKFRLIAVDLPGHGHSSACNPCSMVSMTDVIADFIKQKINGPVVLVGLSLGGHISLGLLERGLDIAGAVLVGTPPANHPINMADMFKLEGTMGLLYKNDQSAEEKLTLARSLYHGPWDVHSEINDIDNVAASFRETFPASLMQGEHINEQSFIKKLKVPTMIVTAKFDNFVNNTYILNNLPPKATVKAYDVGHNLHQEAATQFNTDLLAFADITFLARG